VKTIYSVFDKKTAVFCSPFVSHNDLTAIRDFTSACRDPASVISKFPEDYELYHVGDWDDDTGDIVAGRRFVVAAASLVSSEEF